ncbi:hypothetical protein [Phycicoccus flavus]|uniref:Uncharacterized protein n=1 Tax=Phycicoccus flavus TaxID=2502783 RepID=A0A8T6R4R0_9MICO|nr:hypothetical protein [Phycicoccus flavus]NHA68762.1 hypothetical protein [Phycicoccus flavus]
MSRRDDWQRARRAALDGQSTWRAERAAKDERCSRLGVEVAMALRERDAWVAECEQRAGRALVALTGEEGLSSAETLRWCAGSVTGPEAARLRRLAQATDPADDVEATHPAVPSPESPARGGHPAGED